MPRRGNVAKRDVLPDPMYNSKLVTRLINNIMYDGKKGVAQKIVYDAFEIVEEKTGKNRSGGFRAGYGERNAAAWRLRHAVSAVRPIRFRWRFVRRDVRPWVCAG